MPPTKTPSFKCPTSGANIEPGTLRVPPSTPSSATPQTPTSVQYSCSRKMSSSRNRENCWSSKTPERYGASKIRCAPKLEREMELQGYMELQLNVDLERRPHGLKGRLVWQHPRGTCRQAPIPTWPWQEEEVLFDGCHHNALTITTLDSILASQWWLVCRSEHPELKSVGFECWALAPSN